MNMFEEASRKKLRFNYKGLCTVEDLWDIPLRKLDLMFKELNVLAKTQKEESLLETKDEIDNIVDLKIAIIRYIVNIRMQERNEKRELLRKKERKQKLLEIIETKKDEQLHDMSVEDLTKLAEEM